MKYIINILTTFLVILAIGCAEDKGNYTYSKLNDIEIKGISDTGYIASTLEHLTIAPEFEMALKNDESNLEYSWVINYKEISKERNLDYIIPTTANFGENKCRYTVTNTDSGVKYIYDFSVKIMSAYNFGYYILSQESDNSSLISYLSQGYTDETAWMQTKKIGNIELGDFPREIKKKFGHMSEYSDYGWTFSILTKEGEYNFVETNSFTFMPTKLINNTCYVGNPAGLEFKPNTMIIGNSANYFQTGNGVAVYAKGLVNPPAELDKTYDWEKMGLYEMGHSSDVLWGFDRNTNKIYTINYRPADPSTGYVANKFSFDYINEITGFPSFEGQKILAFDKNSNYNDDYTLSTTDITVITNDNNSSIKIYNKNIKQTLEHYQPVGDPEVVLTEKEFPVSGLTANTFCRIINTDYYFLIGNSLYTSPILNPKLTKVIDIPNELGEAIIFDLGIDDGRMWIATYNESSSEDLKGSVIAVDHINKKIIKTFKNVCAKPVDICTADGNPWW